MASRKHRSRARKSRGDSSQLNLFEAPMQGRPAQAKGAAPLRVRAKRRADAPLHEARVILTPREAADYLNVAVSTLKSWRAKKIGPAWRRKGARLVFYFPEDLDAFLRGGERGPDKP